jgi:hypothetical protein
VGDSCGGLVCDLLLPVVPGLGPDRACSFLAGCVFEAAELLQLILSRRGVMLTMAVRRRINCVTM